MKIKRQNSAIIIEEDSGQKHILFKEEISFRITNPDTLVIYKTENPEEIFIQDQLSNIEVDGIVLTKDTVLEILNTLFP